MTSLQKAEGEERTQGGNLKKYENITEWKEKRISVKGGKSRKRKKITESGGKKSVFGKPASFLPPSQLPLTLSDQADGERREREKGKVEKGGKRKQKRMRRK